MTDTPFMLSFQPFREQHLGLFRQWLALDHIRDFWQEPADEQEFRDKFLVKLPARGVVSFIICDGDQSLGYIQYYEAAKIGGGWWQDEKPGTFGIDLLVGEPTRLGKGLGAEIIRQFVAFMKNKEPRLTQVIIDPDPKNLKAIRAFEKAGFQRDKEIVTPNGATLLMRLRL